MVAATLKHDPFQARDTFDTGSGQAGHLSPVASSKSWACARSPSCRSRSACCSKRCLRNCDGYVVTEDDVEEPRRLERDAAPARGVEIPFKPARVVLQDFTGVPCVVDLAAMRAAMKRLGGDPKKINPLVPVDLVIDHSVQVDDFGTRRRAGSERRAGIRAQPRALRVPALGPEGVQQFPRRAAGVGHRASGESRIPGQGACSCATTRRPGRLPRLARRHRQPHDDDQRPGRRRLGRRRHRGRSVHARPADLHAACPKWSASSSPASCRRARPRPTWC